MRKAWQSISMLRQDALDRGMKDLAAVYSLTLVRMTEDSIRAFTWEQRNKLYVPLKKKP